MVYYPEELSRAIFGRVLEGKTFNSHRFIQNFGSIFHSNQIFTTLSIMGDFFEEKLFRTYPEDIS